MTKQALLNKKARVIEKMPWYIRNSVTEENLQKFSVNQLEALVKITTAAEGYRTSKSPFYTLSATEVIQKQTGIIMALQPDGTVTTETEAEIMLSAACGAYQQYKNSNA